MYDLCCVGHITLDKVVTPKHVAHMAGGTAFYFSHAISKMNASYSLVTALAASEMSAVTDLRSKGIHVTALPSRHSVYFENIYPEHHDHRIQNVLQLADPFLPEHLADTDAAIYHLGPLTAHDMSLGFIKYLAGRGKVSLDVQGYLREVRDQKVFAVDWKEKQEALPCIHILKANESEMEVLTGHNDVKEAARVLNGWGVEEVVITLGSMGSVIYHNGSFTEIPPFLFSEEIDATGCGDTYMAGYLLQRAKGLSVERSGLFASAMAGMKISAMGPFTGSEEEVWKKAGA